MSNVHRPMRIGPAECDECGGTLELRVECALSRRALGKVAVAVLEDMVQSVLRLLDWEVRPDGKLCCPPCRDRSDER